MQILAARCSTAAWAEQATTNDYKNLGTPWDKEHLKSCTLVVHNTGVANAAKVKVLGSVDGENYDVEIQAEVEVAADGKKAISWSAYYTHVVVQIKASVDGSQTTVAARAAGIPV
jgi:hypothetical protein